MLHFSPQFVDFEIVRSREKQHSTEWRRADRKSKHLCRAQSELRLRTMFIEISGDPGTRLWVWDGAHNALAIVYYVSFDCWYIWASLPRSGPQIEVDWQRGERTSISDLRLDTVQSWVQVSRFHFWYCITSSLITKEEHFMKNWTSIAKCWHLSGKFNRDERSLARKHLKRSDGRWNILYTLLFMCNFAQSPSQKSRMVGSVPSSLL